MITLARLSSNDILSVAIAIIVLCVLYYLFSPSGLKADQRPKPPAHPMTKVGSAFALIALLLVCLSFALDAALGLMTAGLFLVLAVICWVFGSAFTKRA